MGLEAQLEVDETSVRRLLNNLHATFSDKIVESAKESTPHDPAPHREGQFTPDMIECWSSETKGHETTIVNNSPQTNILLGGSGVYRTGNEICARNAKYMKFPWRYLGGIWVRRGCVKGVNPRRIHGEPGHIYDLSEDMVAALDKGVDNAVKEWNK